MGTAGLFCWRNGIYTRAHLPLVRSADIVVSTTGVISSIILRISKILLVCWKELNRTSKENNYATWGFYPKHAAYTATCFLGSGGRGGSDKCFHSNRSLYIVCRSHWCFVMYAHRWLRGFSHCQSRSGNVRSKWKCQRVSEAAPVIFNKEQIL